VLTVVCSPKRVGVETGVKRPVELRRDGEPARVEAIEPGSGRRRSKLLRLPGPGSGRGIAAPVGSGSGVPSRQAPASSLGVRPRLATRTGFPCGRPSKQACDEVPFAVPLPKLRFRRTVSGKWERLIAFAFRLTLLPRTALPSLLPAFILADVRRFPRWQRLGAFVRFRRAAPFRSCLR
jgi:hypothetical protein